MKKLIVAMNGLFLLAGILVASAFVASPANASALDMQNRKRHRHTDSRRHGRHHKYQKPKYQRYHHHPSHHPPGHKSSYNN